MNKKNAEIIDLSHWELWLDEFEYTDNTINASHSFAQFYVCLTTLEERLSFLFDIRNEFVIDKLLIYVN